MVGQVAKGVLGIAGGGVQRSALRRFSLAMDFGSIHHCAPPVDGHEHSGGFARRIGRKTFIDSEGIAKAANKQLGRQPPTS
jgi:hypothetical protein